MIPFTTYERLREKAEMLEDVQDYDEAKTRLEEGEEIIPGEVTFGILNGENPVRVWRRHRALTQQQLAQAANISIPYLS